MPNGAGGSGGGGASASFGAPTARAPAFLNSATAAGATISATYSPDIQATDGILYAIQAGVSAAPSNGATGYTNIVGPVKIGGAATWATIGFVPLASNAQASPAITVAGSGSTAVNSYAVVPGLRGSVAVDQSTSDGACTTVVGGYSSVATITPTKTPSLILGFTFYNQGGTLVMPMHPFAGGGTPAASPSAQLANTFFPWGIQIPVGSNSWCSAWGFYSNLTVATAQPLRCYMTNASTSSLSVILLLLNVY